MDTIYQDPQYRYFQYSKGKSVTIVCFNHALEYGFEFKKNILAMNGNASLFSVNSHLYADFNHLFNDINITRKLIVIDDSKSRNRLSERFFADAAKKL